MHYSKKVRAAEACVQVDYRAIPLVGSFCQRARVMLRAVVRACRRSTSKQTACRPPPPFSPVEIQNPSSPSDDLQCQHHLNLVRKSHPSLSICNFLEEGDVHMVGEFSDSGGGFAGLWRGSLDNRQVAIKSYRCYLSTDPSRIFVRFSHEALVCSQLSHKNIISFIGVYSTPSHPFSLVFDFAGHLDLKGYLKTHHAANRLELLVGIARGLDHIHDLDIVHGRLETGNVLVDLDGTPRIGGLGSAFIIGHTTPQSEMIVEGFFWNGALELMYPDALNSKAGDVYAFGMLAWEVFTGLPAVAACTMWKGFQPPHPHHPKVTNRMWKMMEGCWERVPSKHTTIKEVVRTLEAERSYRIP